MQATKAQGEQALGAASWGSGAEHGIGGTATSALSTHCLRRLRCPISFLQLFHGIWSRRKHLLGPLLAIFFALQALLPAAASCSSQRACAPQFLPLRISLALHIWSEVPKC